MPRNSTDDRDTSNGLLMTCNKLPLLMQEVILIVGIQGVGKHALAKAIVNCAGTKQIQCRTVTHLPLPEEHEEDRPKIDMIAFMIDSTNSASYVEVVNSLQYVSKEYFLGRICFIATKVPAQTQILEIQSVTQLCEEYCSNLFWLDPTSDTDRIVVAKKMIEMLDISAGLRPGVTPLLIDATSRK